MASKERLYMYFKNCMAIFKLLERFTVFFLSPMPRYLYKACCTREDHTPNTREDRFEDSQRCSLMECRGFYKDFFFTSGYKNVTVLNPGIEVPSEDETGLQLWGWTQCIRCQRATPGLRIVAEGMGQDQREEEEAVTGRTGASLQEAQVRGSPPEED